MKALPGKVAELARHLLPARRPGERVAASRAAPLPARLDILSLLAPGSTRVRVHASQLVPLVRRWTTTREFTVIDPDGTRRTRTVTEWHREVVRNRDGRPIRVPADDQTGLLPPADWAHQWVTRWRRELRFHTPTRPLNRLPLAAGTAEGRLEAVRRWQAHQAANPQPGVLMPLVAELLAVETDAPAARARRLLGLAGHQPPQERPDDPVWAEWALRYGLATTAAAVEVDVAYLDAWFDQACDYDLRVGEFAAELSALDAELDRAAGRTPDQQWLGRCPAELVDRDTGDTTYCGAGLWQDPHASVVECRRCHSTWPERQWLRLAALIRDVWPIDPRRRYTDTDIAGLRLPTCGTCAATVTVTWREATEPRDRARYWRPTGTFCPNGCDQATAGDDQ